MDADKHPCDEEAGLLNKIPLWYRDRSVTSDQLFVRRFRGEFDLLEFDILGFSRGGDF
jgi:hypothetical protein